MGDDHSLSERAERPSMERDQVENRGREVVLDTDDLPTCHRGGLRDNRAAGDSLPIVTTRAKDRPTRPPPELADGGTEIAESFSP